MKITGTMKNFLENKRIHTVQQLISYKSLKGKALEGPCVLEEVLALSDKTGLPALQCSAVVVQRRKEGLTDQCAKGPLWRSLRGSASKAHKQAEQSKEPGYSAKSMQKAHAAPDG